MARGDSARVSTLELFFDLVFVFTITQVSTVVEHAREWAGLGRAALELWVILWMYGGYAWLLGTAAFRAALHFASAWTRILGAALSELAVLAVYIAATLFAEHVPSARDNLRESIS